MNVVRPASHRAFVAPLALAALAAVAGGCTSAMYKVKAPPAPEEMRVRSTGTVAPPEYRLQLNDLLTVRFLRNPELDQDVRIRPDGKISLPYVNDVAAAGTTPDELAERLSEMYEDELVTPDVTVIVVEFSAHIVYIGGQVVTEGVIPLGSGMTLFQALKAAGGFTRFARRDQVVLIRRDAGGAMQGWAVDTREIANGRDPSLDVQLEPYDVVHVPEAGIANVNQWVDQYIRQNLPINPSSAIAAAAAF